MFSRGYIFFSLDHVLNLNQEMLRKNKYGDCFFRAECSDFVEKNAFRGFGCKI